MERKLLIILGVLITAITVNELFFESTLFTFIALGIAIIPMSMLFLIDTSLDEEGRYDDSYES